MSSRLRVLVVAGDLPFSGEVEDTCSIVVNLSKHLHSLGHDVRVATLSRTWGDKSELQRALSAAEFQVQAGCRQANVIVRQSGLGTVPLYLIQINEREQFGKGKINERSRDARAFSIMSAAALEMTKHLKPNWTPDVVHGIGWQGGLAPFYLRTQYSSDSEVGAAAAIFTIQNVDEQGEFDLQSSDYAGLPSDPFLYEENGNGLGANFTRAGAAYSDITNTVSPTYACEVQTPECGRGLEDLFQKLAKQGRLRGILNGLDYEEYDPQKDTLIPRTYGPANLTGKAECKAALQKEFGLAVKPDIPLVGLIFNANDSKTLDILLAATPKIMELGVQAVIVGSGHSKHESRFLKCLQDYSGQAKAITSNDKAMKRRVYAGSDIMIMPYPAGPGMTEQMLSLRYGAIPVALRTGGLADTVQDIDPHRFIGNGFVYNEAKPGELQRAVKRAVELYMDTQLWQKLVQRAMRLDFSGLRSATEYVRVYREAIETRIASRALAAVLRD